MPMPEVVRRRRLPLSKSWPRNMYGATAAETLTLLLARGKLGKVEAGYSDAAVDVTRACGGCRFYQALNVGDLGNGCMVVEGPINRFGICLYQISADAQLVADAAVAPVPEPVPEPAEVDDLFAMLDDGPLVVRAAGKSASARTREQFVVALRRALHSGEAVVAGNNGTARSVKYDADGDLLRIVPPDEARETDAVVLIGAAPSALDAARGTPFAGAEGRVLFDRYMPALGGNLTRVRRMHAIPVQADPGSAEWPSLAQRWRGWLNAELAKSDGAVMIALGRHAAVALRECGREPDFVLPHPGAVVRHGDAGEVTRKGPRMREAIRRRADEAALWWLCKDHDGIMVSLKMPKSIRSAIAIEGGEDADNLHVTLAYVKGDHAGVVERVVREFASGLPPITGTIAGTGRFNGSETSDWKDVIYASVDAPALSEFRQRLVNALSEAGAPPSMAHGYVPHITLAYAERGSMAELPLIETTDVVFDHVRVQRGEHVLAGVPLDGDAARKSYSRSQPLAVSVVKVDDEKRVVYGVALSPHVVGDSQGDWVPPSEVEDAAHAFLTGSRVIGFGHEREADAVPVESFVWPYPTPDDRAKAMRNEAHQAYRQRFGAGVVRSGDWIVGTRVNDEAIWQAIKAGELTSYSIGGWGQRTPVATDAAPEVEFVDVG